ncbi:ribonuclease HI [Paraclostridium bifermentans]
MDRIEMYCDGGCRGNQSDKNIGAWGVYIEYKDVIKKYSDGERNTTNNIMELKACIEGMKNIKIKTVPVTVYLDSAYVLNGITSWIAGWKKNGWRSSNKKPVKNRELWVELDKLKSEFTDIKFVKVKGHSDNQGNIEADLLCNLKMDEMEVE